MGMISSYFRYLVFIFMALLISACATTDKLNVPLENSASESERFSFRVIGDLPYNATQAYSLVNNITPKLRESTFVIHIGDYKPGNNSACTAELDQNHNAWMTSLGVPVFYTPGDNDWTDCDRASNAPVVRETERLKTIRKTFFNGVPASTPTDWNVEQHPNMPENASWIYENVRFATIHVVGGNNGRNTLETCVPGSICDTPEDIAQIVGERDVANDEWLKTVFSKALDEDAAAMVIATHADMLEGFKPGITCETTFDQDCDGFKNIKELIIEQAADFKRPVLLIHGDTNPYCWERKMGGERAPNLSRLNSAGDFVLVDAVEVSVDPAADIPFTAKTVLSELLPAENECRQ
jgi:hypothetical protein